MLIFQQREASVSVPLDFDLAGQGVSNSVDSWI